MVLNLQNLVCIQVDMAAQENIPTFSESANPSTGDEECALLPLSCSHPVRPRASNPPRIQTSPTHPPAIIPMPTFSQKKISPPSPSSATALSCRDELGALNLQLSQQYQWKGFFTHVYRHGVNTRFLCSPTDQLLYLLWVHG